MAGFKTKRIASELVEIISNILANEANDDLLKTVTITGCEVTNDLSFAKVYFTSLSNLTKEELEKELKEASRYVRGEVSKRIDLRHTPEIRFIYDDSIAYGKKIENIIKEIHEEDNEREIN